MTGFLAYAIIRGVKPIATANYDFESLIKGGYDRNIDDPLIESL